MVGIRAFMNVYFFGSRHEVCEAAGGVTSMNQFLEKFFPSVLEKERAASSQNNYCKYDSHLISMFTSSLYLAALTSSLIASTVTRKLGRKLSMLLGGLLFFVGAFINCFSRFVWMLILGRILQGFGVGFANQVSLIRRIHIYNLDARSIVVVFAVCSTLPL